MGNSEYHDASAGAASTDKAPYALSANQGGDEQVDIHKPKAVHGWRELLNEIGVIVIGVLIALAAEQAVESVHWSHQVETGRAALREEALGLIENGATREAVSACLGARLTAIASVLDQAAESGRLPAVGQLGSPGMAPWGFAAWDSLMAAQIPAHMTHQDMLAYGGIASQARSLRELNLQEQGAWVRLYTIVGPGRRFSDAEQASARGALSEAVLKAKLQRLYAEQLRQLIEQAGILSPVDVAAVRSRAAARYARDARDGIMCKPLDAAPPADHYGQAPSPVNLSALFKI